MKRILFIVAAITIAVNAFAQYNPHVISNQPQSSIDSLTAKNLAVIQNQSGEYLYKAGKNLTWSMVCAGASAATSWMASDVATNNNSSSSDNAKLLSGVSIGFAAAAIICVISAASKLKDAGKLQQKIHPATYGLAIDL